MNSEESLTKGRLYKLYHEGRVVVLPSSNHEAVIQSKMKKKNPFKSKTIDAIILLLALSLNQLFGVYVPEDNVGELVYAVVTMASAAFAIWGRVKASGKIAF